jgi:1-acyl-sn-glycerol-3-phosphate acyltransferase
MPGQLKSELRGIRAAVFPALSLAYLLLIFGLPLTLCAALWRQSGTKWQPVALLGCPFLYAVLFTLVAGLLSIPHQKGIIAGKFPRDVGHRVYFHRRLYGLCWTALFYFKPVYFLILTIDPLRRCTFRLFGYRGRLDFTIYPDTWIRDLPLLNFGSGAYIANRSTLGSNICLQSGEILVGEISVGDRSVVGHLGVIGLGSTMEADSELGVGVATGIQVRIGRNTKIGAISGLNHGSSVGNDCDIGAMSYVGSGTRVLDGVQLPAASISADHLVIENQTQVQPNVREPDPIPNLGAHASPRAWLDATGLAHVEDHYRACSYVKEICVLSPDGEQGSGVTRRLHAIIVPNLDLARSRQVVNVGEIIRFEFDTLSAKLPDTHRISSYEVWPGPLPRTNSGDLDRIAIVSRIRESDATSTRGSGTFQRQFNEEDNTWLDRPEVRRALDVLRAKTKSPRSIYHPEDNLEFDLGLDSMGRIEVLIALEVELGVSADNRAAIEAYTIRELVDSVLTGESSQPVLSGWQAVFDSELSPGDLEFFEAGRTFSAPLWFAVGRVIEVVGKAFFGLQVLGRENLPKSGPFIICSNHQSYLDAPFVLSVLPWNLYKNVFLVGTSELFGKGILRVLAGTLRLSPIDPDVNLLPAMRISAHGLSRGLGLLLYPEGERSIDGAPKAFKKGAGLLAAHLKVPIYPLAIDGFSEAWPRGRRFAKFARLKMKFGQAVCYPANIDSRPADEVITERVRDSIVEMWEELRNGECEVSGDGKRYCF